MYLGKDTSCYGIEPTEWAAHAARRLRSRETAEARTAASPSTTRSAHENVEWESADDSRLVDLVLDIARSESNNAAVAHDRARTETHWTRILSLDLDEDRADDSASAASPWTRASWHGSARKRMHADNPACLDDPYLSGSAFGGAERDPREAGDRVGKLVIRGIVVLAAVYAALYLAVAAIVHMAKAPDATAALVPHVSAPTHAASARPRAARDTSRMY